MREWCCRKDFRDALPELLLGEDDDFRAHIQQIAEAEAARSAEGPVKPAAAPPR